MTDVLLLAPKYPPDSGGASVYTHHLVQLLEPTEWSVSVFTPRRPENPEITEEHGATIYRTFPQVGGRIYAGLNHLRRFHRLLTRVDPAVVHVHPHFPQYRWFRWLLKYHGTPRVYDCRDMDFTRRYVTDGAAYLSVTESVDECLQDAGVAAERIRRAPVCMPNITPEPMELGDGLHVAFVGELVGHKGVRLAVDAMRGLAVGEPVTLHIAGAGKLEEWVQTVAGEQIAYHGNLKHERAVGLIEAVDAVVIPSKREARPRVALEAMSMGTPVVATNAGDLPEVIDGAGVIVPRDGEAIQDGIRAVLSTDTYREQAERRSVAPDPDTLRGNIISAYNMALE